MNILWHSNSPMAPTGYGNQTKLFAPLIRDAVDELVISAFYGCEGGLLRNPHGILELPRHRDLYGNDVIRAHMGYTKSDAVISLIDPFVLKHDVWGALNWWAWVPVDSAPNTQPNIDALKHARGMWAMSKFGYEQLVAEFGRERVRYVPHGVDTSVFRPVDRKAAREKLSRALKFDFTDRFVVMTNAANKGSPSRKNFAGMFAAFAEFAASRPDALFYVHSHKTGHGGVDLVAMAKQYGILDKIVFPPEYNYIMGMISDVQLNDLYNMADVFMLLSLGEGFGIPIIEAQAAGCPVIVTDGSATSELCLSGWLIPGEPVPAGPGREGCWWWRANVPDAVDALHAATIDGDAMRADARLNALTYDIRLVWTRHMLPAIEAIQQAVNPVTIPVSTNGKASATVFTGDVSVVIPTLNGERTIKRAVDSALDQTGLRMQVIVVDDGSTDGTCELMQAYTSDERVVYVRHPENVGQVAAMNTALERATGDYIMFYGDDDWLKRAGLQYLARALDNAPDDVAFAYGHLQYHGRRNDLLRADPFDVERLWHHNMIGSAWIVRRDVLNQHEIRYRTLHDGKTAHAEDYDMLLRLVDLGYRGVPVDALVLNYTLADGRATAWLHANQAKIIPLWRERYPNWRGVAL